MKVIAILIVCVIGAAVIIFTVGALFGPPASVHNDIHPDKARYEECVRLIQTAYILESIRSVAKDESSFTAGRLFQEMPIDAKQGLADKVDCVFNVGDPHYHSKFMVLDYATGHPIGEYDYGSLKIY